MVACRGGHICGGTGDGTGLRTYCLSYSALLRAAIIDSRLLALLKAVRSLLLSFVT